MTWTYSSLKTKVGTWLNRADLADYIPDFITMAEAQMNRRLDCRQMVTVTTISIAAETYTLPSDFGGVKSFRLNTDPVTALEYRYPEEFDDVRLDAFARNGKPVFFTIMDGSFYFEPAPDATYAARLSYRTRIPELSDTNTSNWLLELHPDAYLYGALMQAEPFLKNDERIAVWGSLFEAAINAINTDDDRQNTASRPAARVKRIG